METSITVAEILKTKKPIGLKLYSSTFDYIKFNGVYKDKIYSYSEDSNAHSVKPDGKMHDGGECIIFPSKEMRDWSKFTWKKGDVLVSNDDSTEVIFDVCMMVSLRVLACHVVQAKTILLSTLKWKSN